MKIYIRNDSAVCNEQELNNGNMMRYITYTQLDIYMKADKPSALMASVRTHFFCHKGKASSLHGCSDMALIAAGYVVRRNGINKKVGKVGELMVGCCLLLATSDERRKKKCVLTVESIPFGIPHAWDPNDGITQQLN